MISRTLRAVAATAAATVALGMVGTTAAHARPVKPGGITNLTASATAAAGKYNLNASWDPSPNATSYRVAVVKSGTTLASATVKTTSWSGTVTTTPGNASLSVRAVIARKPGPSATTIVNLPDVTPPSGTFTTSWDNGTGAALLTQATLSDDAGPSQVTRTVNWDDGSPAQLWATGTTLDHTYPASVPHRYQPTVTLKDSAGNTSVVNAPAVVIDDVTAPTGSFAVTQGSAWATYTPVTLTQSALSDNFSPAANITRSVAWGDGTTTDWTGTGPLTHVYSVVGTYTPAVTITDEAHQSAIVQATAVVVTADTVKPVLRLTLPRAKHSVKAWTTLRGKATDTNGSGVKVVSLRAVEKRGTVWYGYQATTKRWVKAATMAKAFAKSRAFSLTTSATHAWSGKLAGLRKGTLVYKVRANDNVGNLSALVTHKASLTQR